MKYLYYYLWISLAFVHHKVSVLFFTLNKIIFKIRKVSKEDQKRWKDDYNLGFLGFPGGMVDWAAFGFLLIIVFFIIIFIIFIFDLDMFKPKIHLTGLFIVLTGLIYYLIYFKNLPWLKQKIRIINKKYFL